jgi:hypothetical protein
MAARLPHLLLEETGMDFTSPLEVRCLLLPIFWSFLILSHQNPVPKTRKLNAENSFASSDGDDQSVDQNQHHAPHLDNTMARSSEPYFSFLFLFF